MKNFTTMPLRLRVWDNHRHIFVPWYENFCLAFDEGGRVYLSNIDWDNKDLPEEDNDRFIVSQDTGLKDKNGKSIFTGDIIKVYDKGHKNKLYGTFLVQYDIENGELVLCSGLDMDSAKLGGAPLWAKYVVVGNIWENPELLKGGHDD